MSYIGDVESSRLAQLATAATPAAEPELQPSASSDVQSQEALRQQKSKQKRASRACDSCRTVRRTCGGHQPCPNCVKKGIDCTYNLPYIRGRPRTPPPGEGVRGPADVVPNISHIKVRRGAPRVKRNCDLCRTQKRICSGTNPCDKCVSLNLPCTYLLPPTRKHVEDVVMDDVHADDNPDRESCGDVDEEDKNEDSESPAAPATTWPYGAPEVSILPPEESQPEVPGPLTPFLQKAWQKLADYHKRGTIPAGDQPFKTVPGTPLRFPAPKMTNDLVDNFFQCWDGVFYFLHRPTVNYWIERVCENKNNGRPLSDQIGNSTSAIALMVLAMGALYPEKVARPRKHDESAWVYNLAATDHYLTESMTLTDSDRAPTKLESVQARLLQDMYLFSTCRMNQAWQTFGNTLQLITLLRLHRKATRNRMVPLVPGQNPDYVKQQCEMRIFYTAYNLDKYVTMLYGRPSHFSDDEIDQTMPDAINDEDIGPNGPIRTTRADCTVSFIIFQTKLTKLVEKLYREVYTLKEMPEDRRLDSARRIGKEIEDWKDDLPYIFGGVKANSLLHVFRRQSIYLRLAHCHALIFAYRPFLLGAQMEGENARISLECVRKCVEAARVALHVVWGLGRNQDKHIFKKYWFVQYVGFISLCVMYTLPYYRYKEFEATGRTHAKMDAKMWDVCDKAVAAMTEDTYAYSFSQRCLVVLAELSHEAKRHTARPAIYPRPDKSAQTLAEKVTDDSQEQHILDALAAELDEETSAAATERPTEAELPPEYDVWKDWATTDWLDLDSAAFGPIAEFAYLSPDDLARPATASDQPRFEPVAQENAG